MCACSNASSATWPQSLFIDRSQFKFFDALYHKQNLCRSLYLDLFRTEKNTTKDISRQAAQSQSLKGILPSFSYLNRAFNPKNSNRRCNQQNISDKMVITKCNFRVYLCMYNGTYFSSKDIPGMYVHISGIV